MKKCFRILCQVFLKLPIYPSAKASESNLKWIFRIKHELQKFHIRTDPFIFRPRKSHNPQTFFRTQPLRNWIWTTWDLLSFHILHNRWRTKPSSRLWSLEILIAFLWSKIFFGFTTNCYSRSTRLQFKDIKDYASNISPIIRKPI